MQRHEVLLESTGPMEVGGDLCYEQGQSYNYTIFNGIYGTEGISIDHF